MEIFGVVTAYGANNSKALVIIIPKELREKHNIQKGKRYVVKADDKGRIIYEPKP